MQGLSDLHVPMLTKEKTSSTDPSSFLKLTRKQWWFLVALNISFLIFGQTSAVLLAKYYYNKGGSSTFMASLVQTAGFPILFIPLVLLPSIPKSSRPEDPTKRNIVSIYIILGLLQAISNILYSVGLLYLSASTSSLIGATQMAFTAVFSFFINSQKFTPLILNSVVILSFSTALLAINEDSNGPTGGSKLKFAIGFSCALGDAAAHSLLLSLMQHVFEKVLKSETFGVVMEMEIYASLVATIVSMGCLYVSGQWMDLGGEMKNFDAGSVSYVMTLVGTAISWQVSSLGVVGLIFLVSSLFSNVISTVAFIVAPLASLIVFHDKMNGVKAIAMLQALWGFASYFFQNYLDDFEKKKLEAQSQIDSDDYTSLL